MDTPPAMSRRNPPPVVLPDEIIVEILSYVGVKTLLQLRTVCKAWKSLISNPTFVNLHLQRSPRNPHLTLLWHEGCYFNPSGILATFPVRRLLENQPINDGVDTYCYSVKLREYTLVVGSYNGLVCFYGRNDIGRGAEYWLGFQNPAMGMRSEKLGHFIDFEHSPYDSFMFSFGYDISTGTYKVVAFGVIGQENDEAPWRSEVKIFNLVDKSWRKIQSFPVPPLGLETRFGKETRFGNSKANNGVHLIGTVNWIALSNTFISLYDWKHINVEDFVIFSLSLSTETYTLLLLPEGFNEVPRVQPTLRALRNCLCFSHDFRGTEFVIWQMREFGVRESWTQLIKVSYQTLQMKNLSMHDDYIYDIQLLPLYLSENSDTLIFANYANNENYQDAFFANNEEGDNAIIYNWKDGRVERIGFSKDILWFCTVDYVESLVPIT